MKHKLKSKNKIRIKSRLNQFSNVHRIKSYVYARKVGQILDGSNYDESNLSQI